MLKPVIENLTIFVIYSSNNSTSRVSILNAGIISTTVRELHVDTATIEDNL